MKKRILLGASYSVIEPLGLLHLGGLARNVGWDRQYYLVKDHNFEPLFEKIKDFKPDVVGFNVYTGNHMQLHTAYQRLKKDFPNIITIVGGPHATYFPSESANYADYVVMSEGFGALRKILNNKVKPGILPLQAIEQFPHPDRATFYEEYTEHAKSRIKSTISMTGCPYKCTYCYNSSTPKDIAGNMPPEVADQLAKTMGMGGRLFPHNVRSVEEVIAEGKEIAEHWPTEVVYFQDDVHAFDVQKWMPEFAERWPNEVKIPYHAQMRWEMTKDERRLDVLCKAGCFGLTLAIEAADPFLRTEVLDRTMGNELMFKGMKAVTERGLKVRTEQITGLPYGATSKSTPMNLDADLQLIELNVALRRESGGPTMAWASTLAPYRGTKLGTYCERFGHYAGDNHDVPDTFFERSVLRFPREWIGLELEKRKVEQNVWLDDIELEKYRNQNAELRRNFNFFALVPKGHALANSYLGKNEPFTYERLGKETIEHLHTLAYQDSEARIILERISALKSIIAIEMQRRDERDGLAQTLDDLAPYFACLPKGEQSFLLALKYADERGNGKLIPSLLSTAVRHHLYDKVLYAVDNFPARLQMKENEVYSRLEESSRFPAKV